MSGPGVGPFLAAYKGERAGLKIDIDGGGLRDGVHAESGIYEISADEVRRMCDLLAREYPHRTLSGEAVAEALDDGAGADRWIRMSRAVAAWIKDKRPIHAFDGSIG